MNTGRRIAFLPLLAVLLALVAIGGGVLLLTGREATPDGALAGADIGGPFRLVNQDGQTVTERDFAGRYRLMYFGYSYCPDVCPDDVQTLALGLKAFEASDPERARRVQPIFVTVDPRRDTPPVVKEFVNAFHPRLVGLTGSEEAIEAAKGEWRVFAAKAGDAEATDYLMNHSNLTYLMGPDNQPITYLAGDATPADVAAALDAHVG